MASLETVGIVLQPRPYDDRNDATSMQQRSVLLNGCDYSLIVKRENSLVAVLSDTSA